MRGQTAKRSQAADEKTRLTHSSVFPHSSDEVRTCKVLIRSRTSRDAFLVKFVHKDETRANKDVRENTQLREPDVGRNVPDVLDLLTQLPPI